MQSLLVLNGQTQISGGQFTSVVNNYQVTHPSKPPDGFEQLRGQIAVTALHNALDSVASGRCHVNTREAVLDDLFRFVQEDHKTRKSWILWLSGPAGSGKTTIARTIAYLCEERSVDQASFFFCRMDVTRNGIKPLIATLAYQIACRFPEVKDRIVAEVEQSPHVFDLSVEEQFKRLVISPLTLTRSTVKPRPHPIVCVIDALDECENAVRDNSILPAQSNVVTVLHKLASAKGSPVVFMLASRPEAHLRMTFNRISHSVTRVYLDNSYNPSADIHRFVVDQFAEIRASHPFASLLPMDWPPTTTINTIVTKSSGQFLYAATVMRHISSPFGHPALRLDEILSSLPAGPLSLRAMPFTELDNLFIFILDKSACLPIVLDILSCHIVSQDLSDDWFSLLLQLYGHDSKLLDVYLIDVVSLVGTDDKKQRLVIHNESLVDFLVDSQRSGRFHIKAEASSYGMLMKALQLPVHNVPLILDYAITLPKIGAAISGCDPDLDLALVRFSRVAVDMSFEPCVIASKVKQLLAMSSHSWETYHKLCQIWSKRISPESEDRLDRVKAPGTLRQLCLSYSGAGVSHHSSRKSHAANPRTLRVEAALRNINNPSELKEMMEFHCLSMHTGLSFDTVSGIMGYDRSHIRHILATYSSLLRYDPKGQTITFRDGPGQDLLGYMTGAGAPRFRLNDQGLANRAIVQLKKQCKSYKGNLFGDMGALLFHIHHYVPPSNLAAHMLDFSTTIMKSRFDVHVLDFTIFLDGLVHLYHKRFPVHDGLNHSPRVKTPDYTAILKPFVRFWASREQQLDPQLLSIPEFGRLWQEL